MQYTIKPNFVVVGAAKAGTTNLYSYLTQHPEVYIPEMKECRYFSQIGSKRLNPYNNKITEFTDVISTSNEYYELFKNKGEFKALGDISPDYLFYYKNAVSKIKDELGSDTRIIILLRNPVERAYSNYLHLIREEATTDTFEGMIAKEEKWNQSNIWYGFKLLESSMYYNAVKAYTENFKQVKVIIFEDFIKNLPVHLKEICTFLAIDPEFSFREPEIRNKTGAPKNKFLNHILLGNVPFRKQIKKLMTLFVDEKKVIEKIHKAKEKNLYKPEMLPETRKMLQTKFMDELNKLEELLNTDLSSWRS